MAYDLPLTAMGIAFLLGVLAVDLTIDMGRTDAPQLATGYYTAHRTATEPAKFFVISGIAVTFVLAVVRTVTKRTWQDVLSFVIMLGALGIFVARLIPVQESIAAAYPANATPEQLAEVRQWHIVIVAIMVVGLLLQISGHKRKLVPQKQA